MGHAPQELCPAKETSMIMDGLRHRLVPLACALVLCIGLQPIWSEKAIAQGYSQTNLVSNIPGLAAFTDPNLVNPWGIALSPASPFWISDNGTGLLTLYNGAGKPQALVVTVAPP